MATVIRNFSTLSDNDEVIIDCIDKVEIDDYGCYTGESLMIAGEYWDKVLDVFSGDTITREAFQIAYDKEHGRMQSRYYLVVLDGHTIPLVICPGLSLTAAIWRSAWQMGISLECMVTIICIDEDTFDAYVISDECLDDVPCVIASCASTYDD